jgi:hypothetical protein
LHFDLQDEFLRLIEGEGWFDQGANQAMRFGELPPWAQQLAGLLPPGCLPPEVRPSAQGCLQGRQSPRLVPCNGCRRSPTIHPLQIMNRSPVFDQMIVNLYRPGEGITEHVDLLRFEVRDVPMALAAGAAHAARQGMGRVAAAGRGRSGGQASWRRLHTSAPGRAAAPAPLPSLRSNLLDAPLLAPLCQRHRQRAGLACALQDGIAVFSFGGPVVMRLSRGGRSEEEEEALLQGGDLLLLCGEARYQWAHGIASVHEVGEGEGRGGSGPETAAACCIRRCLGCWLDCWLGCCLLRALEVGGWARRAVLRSWLQEQYQGQRVVRSRRVSVTLRRLCSGIVLGEEVPADLT